MYLERHFRNGIKVSQSISEAKRKVFQVKRLPIGLGCRPATCQWIEGEAKQRNFCAAPVKDQSPYCEEHHARCYIKVLTEDPQT